MTHRTRFILGLCLGLIATAFGALWSLQGAGAIRLRPILCVSDCKPIAGGSAPWLVLGLAVLLVGVSVLGASLRGRGARGRG